MAAACCAPVWAVDWMTETTTSSHNRSHCWVDGYASCWVTYTNQRIAYKAYFGTQQDATAACMSKLDGIACAYASGEPGPPLMSGGWLTTCPGGVNQYGLCVFTLNRHATAYFPTVVAEQDVERPADCPATGRRFGNPIDGLTGEKHERLPLLQWSGQAPPLALHYRSAGFARQVGTSTLTANNIPGLPGASGSVGLGLPDSAGSRPFGPLWTHGLDSRVTQLADGVRLSRIAGSGGLLFRGKTDGSLMLPPADQPDRLQYKGGAGGAHWLHRDPRTLRSQYFSAAGMLVHVVNADGTGRQWLSYSDAATPRAVAAGPDRLLAVRDALGRQLRVGYRRDAQGLAIDLISDVTDDLGERTSFEYDTSGRLTGLRWPDGSAQRLTYDLALPWALAARIDEAGVAVGGWTWNPATGLVTSTSGADGVNRHLLRFAQPPHVTVTDVLEGRILRRKYSWQPGAGAEVTRPNGSVVALGSALRNGSLQLLQRSQPAGVGCDASTSAMSLDLNGNAIVKDDFAGARTCHAYDTTRNLELVRVEGVDRSASCPALLADGAVLPPGAHKITTRWHPVWPIAEIVASPGRTETRVYNDRPDPFAGGSVSSCMPWMGGGDVPTDIQPAALCRRVQRATTDRNGSQGLAAATDPGAPPRDERWTYTRHGQPLSHDGPRTDVADLTTWSYHAATTADARAGDLAELRNGLGQAWRFHRWGQTGLLLSSSDANGVRTDLVYDRRQRLVSSTAAAGTPWARQTVQHWDARGLLRRTDLPPVMASNAAGTGGSAQGKSIRYEYDRAHRLVGVFTGTGQGESYWLDVSGNVVATNVHHGDDTTRPPTVQLREFDALDRPWRAWSVIHGVPRATELAHDAMGRLTTIQRPLASVHGDSQPPREQRRYDKLGRLIQVESSALAPLQPTVLSHDPAGGLAAVTSGGGARFEFDNDGFAQARQTRSSDSGVTNQRHDAAGNLSSVTDARGVTSTHAYDALNRRIRTERRSASVSDGSEDIRYTWDSNPGAPLSCSHGMGRLCRVDDGTGSRHFAYDPFGNLVEQLTVELGQTHRQSFAWNAEGRLLANADAGGASLLWRDGDGHARAVLATVAGRTGALVTLDAMRANGDAGLRQLGNGVVVKRTHDSSGAVTSQADSGLLGPATGCTPPTAACGGQPLGAR